MGRGDTGSVIEAFKSDMSSISDSLGLTESSTDRYARETGEEAEKELKRRLSANSQGSFADLDLLERGGARELNYSSQEVILKPAPFKFSWQKCYLMASKKENSFRMYTEKTKEFLLSAVQHGDDFYISKYEDFPQRFKEGQELKTSWALSTGQIGHTMSEFKEKLMSSVGSSNDANDGSGALSFPFQAAPEDKEGLAALQRGSSRFCAKLVGNTKCTFTLFSTHCEFCDGNELNRFTCGGALAPHNECRQRLGDIRHSLRKIKGVKGVHARHLHYVIPAVSSVDLDDEEAEAARERAARTSWLGSRGRRADGMLGKGHRRVPWCPRVGREFSTIRKSARGLRFGATALHSELKRKRSNSGRRGSAAALGVPVYARELGRTESPYTVVDSLEKESWMSLAAKGSQREKEGDSDKDDLAGALGGGGSKSGRGDDDDENGDGEGDIYLTESHGSKLPEWNDDIGSLVLSFQEHRVLKSSAKNFLLVTGGNENSKKEPPRPRAGTAEAAAAAAREERREKRRKQRRRHRSRYDTDSDDDEEEDEDGLEEERATIQFGKAKAGRYNIDFRYPICPLQAFGVALSTFAWKLEADK